jgi:hypothetical protein
MKRNCDNCQKPYEADARNVNRGWGLCCSKSCAASKREKSKPGYDPARVEKNNDRRILWATGGNGGYVTAEGYRVRNGVAYDEWDNPVYAIDDNDNEHPFSSEGLGQW